MKIAIAAVCCVLLMGPTNQARVSLEGNPSWLAEKGCTQPDPQQCALEVELKRKLSWGRIDLGSTSEAHKQLMKELFDQ